jgi:splicing factor 1
MQELSGNPSAEGPAGRIEAAPGGYDQGDSYGGSGGGGGGGESRPWARQPTGAAAPWQRDRQERDYGNRDAGSSLPPWQQSRGGDAQGGYGAAPGQAAGGAAPWQQQPPPGQNYGNYAGYSGYDTQATYGAPPAAAPPGLSSFLQQYGSAPPPPSDAQAPPPPPDEQPPPPPGMGDYVPPPPPSA